MIELAVRQHGPAGLLCVWCLIMLLYEAAFETAFNAALLLIKALVRHAMPGWVFVESS